MRRIATSKKALCQVVLLLYLGGCVTHDTFMPVIKVPAYYPCRASIGKCTIVADPYTTKEKASFLFGKDIRRKGVYPVHVLFFNEGDTAYSIDAMTALLCNENTVCVAPLAETEVTRSVLNNTSQQIAAYGLLGSAFLILTVPFALSAGVSSMRTNSAIKKDIAGKFVFEEILEPHSIIQGFLFFPVDGKNKQQRMHACLAPHTLILKHIKDLKTQKQFTVEIAIN